MISISILHNELLCRKMTSRMKNSFLSRNHKSYEYTQWNYGNITPFYGWNRLIPKWNYTTCSELYWPILYTKLFVACRCHMASVNWVNTGSWNSMVAVRSHAINWINTDLLSVGPLETNFNEIKTVSSEKIHLAMSSLLLWSVVQGPLLIKWINFNHSINNYLRPSYSVGWKNLTMPEFQQLNHWNWNLVVISCHTLLGMWKFIQTEIAVKSCR